MPTTGDPPTPPPDAPPEEDAPAEAPVEEEPAPSAESPGPAPEDAGPRQAAPREGGRGKRMRHFLWLAFSPAGHVHHVPVDPRRFTLKAGDLAVVETDRGLSIGRVLREPTPSDELTPSRRVRKVVRPAREPDLLTHAEGKARELELLMQTREIAGRIKPDIRILGVDHQAIGNKITVYFASEKRVDFRALVRELSQGLGLRIEMRQIGVRDEAKKVGGLGHCGRELCCGTFLSEFCAVSIRMAKDQNLALSPNKISGLCGRLMCCLSYEHPAYAAHRKGLPKTGKRILTSAGPGRVLSVDVLQRKFSLLGDDGVRQTLEADAIERDEEGRPIRPPPPGQGSGEGPRPRGAGRPGDRRPKRDGGGEGKPRRGKPRGGRPKQGDEEGKGSGGRKRGGGRRRRGRGRGRRSGSQGSKESSE